MASIPSHLRRARPVEPGDRRFVQKLDEPKDVGRCVGCGVWVGTAVCEWCEPWYLLARKTA